MSEPTQFSVRQIPGNSILDDNTATSVRRHEHQWQSSQTKSTWLDVLTVQVITLLSDPFLISLLHISEKMIQQWNEPAWVNVDPVSDQYLSRFITDHGDRVEMVWFDWQECSYHAFCNRFGFLDQVHMQISSTSHNRISVCQAIRDRSRGKNVKDHLSISGKPVNQ